MPVSISVVIPACDAAHHLAQCLAALRNSLVRPAEIIVVDDGSKDNTGDVALAFGGARPGQRKPLRTRQCAQLRSHRSHRRHPLLPRRRCLRQARHAFQNHLQLRIRPGPRCPHRLLRHPSRFARLHLAIPQPHALLRAPERRRAGFDLLERMRRHPPHHLCPAHRLQRGIRATGHRRHRARLPPHPRQTQDHPRPLYFGHSSQALELLGPRQNRHPPIAAFPGPN